MKVDPKLAAIGQRMRVAALEAGFSAPEVAAHVGVSPITMYRWWWGQRSPSPAKMQAYADQVRKPLIYFYGAEPEAPEQPREVLDLLLRWADLVMAGERAPAAFHRVIGKRGQLTRSERRKLDVAEAGMREDLIRAAGGAWELLTEAQRREILERIVQVAAEGRPNPQEPSS